MVSTLPLQVWLVLQPNPVRIDFRSVRGDRWHLVQENDLPIPEDLQQLLGAYLTEQSRYTSVPSGWLQFDAGTVRRICTCSSCNGHGVINEAPIPSEL